MLVYYTSPCNTCHPCSSALEDQPKRRLGCDAVVRATLDGGSAVFAGGPKPFSLSVCQAHEHDGTYIFPCPHPRVKMKIRPQEVPERPPPLRALITLMSA